MPKISVIMASYNMASTLPRAIDSVLAQTFKDFELIIVDDGSADSTPKILQDYADKDKRIRVITQSNQGLPTARNTGVAKSSGKYVTFIDSDDAYAVNHLSSHINFLEENSKYSACVFSKSANIENYHKGASFHERSDHTLCYGSPFSSRKILGGLGAPAFMTRDSFMSIGGYRKAKTIIEDLDFTLRYSEKNKWAKIYGEGGYFYTYPHNNSKSSLTNIDPHTFVKRHLASYVSGWCRINKVKDPITEDRSLEEIISIAKSMPLKDKAIIYWSMKFFMGMPFMVNNMSRNKAKLYLLNNLSDYKIIHLMISLKFKALRRKSKLRLD